MDAKFYETLELAINAHCIVVITDTQGTITFANAKTEEISGYTKAELIGQNHRVLKSGVHPIEFWQEMYTTISHGTTWHSEICNRAKDGHLYWVDTTIVPVLGEDEKPQSYIAIRTDITQLKRDREEKQTNAIQLMIAQELALQNEEKAKRAAELIAAQSMLKEKEQSLQSLLDSVAEGIYGVDVAGYCTFVNRSFLRIMGFDQEHEVLGKHIHELIHHSYKDGTFYPSEACKMYQSTLTNQTSYADDEVFWKRDGTCIDVEYWSYPIIREGILVGSVATFLDITEQNQLKKQQKQHEQQMFQQSRLAQMGEMISMIAHQWRQPLAAVAATTFNMRLKIELDAYDLSTQSGRESFNEFFIEKLNNTEHLIQNLSATIDDFRNFYKPDKITGHCSYKNVVNRALHIIRNSLKIEKIELIEEYDDTLELEMYENEMVQVILNILKNAQDNFIEKMTPAPYIRITSQNNTLMICDNGGGIKEAIYDKIFDPYFSTKNEKNGTGLGLYMSKMIVEDHHKGTLDAYNHNEGVCFSIVLPHKISLDV